MPRGSQLSRQWRLLQLIDRPSGVTLDDAAHELDCTTRTVWRDLSALQNAGFPIYSEKAADGHRGLWRVVEGFKASLPLNLTLPELVALLMSRQLLGPLGAGPLGPAVGSAFAKIENVLSRDALKLIDQMRETIGVRGVGAKLQAPAAELVPKIQSALLDRRTIRMRYYSMSRDEESDRSVDPYHLTYYDGGLYLVAYCHMRKAVRMFAVERIRSLQPLAQRFTVQRGFDLKAYLDEALGIVHGELITVRVVFARAVAPYMKERLWHPTQTLRELPDGRVELTMRVADTLEVRRWILGYGVEAEVVEPAGLREALRAEAEALSAMLAPRRRELATVRKRVARAKVSAS
jgi:predicted DNA-binding transcriptional regulator YafY